MGRGARRLDAWFVVLGSINLTAWSVLSLDSSDLTLTAFCSETRWAVPLSASLDLALAFNLPAKLAWGWALMVAAMMSPLIGSSLRHIRDRSFARRRARGMLLFIAGYAAVWMTAGLGLQAIALAGLWVAPTPVVCFGLATTAALLWQISPAKQWCLNRCHRRPHLAAFGAAADYDAFNFGLTNGMACAGACWALMLLPLFVEHGHVLAMIVVALFVFAERLDGPTPLRWHWRGPSKALRIIIGQVRMRLISQRALPTNPVFHESFAKYRRLIAASANRSG